MKYLNFLFAVAFIGLFVTSCKNKKNKNEETYLRPSSIVFTGEDSTEVRSLIGNFVGLLNNHDFTAASASLYQLKDGNPEKLSVEKCKSFEQFLSQLPYKQAKEESFRLRGDKDNKIRIALLLNPNGSIDDNKGVINIILNPVLVDGKWYLTLRDEEAEGVGPETAE